MRGRMDGWTWDELKWDETEIDNRTEGKPMVSAFPITFLISVLHSIFAGLPIS